MFLYPSIWYGADPEQNVLQLLVSSIEDIVFERLIVDKQNDWLHALVMNRSKLKIYSLHDVVRTYHKLQTNVKDKELAMAVEEFRYLFSQQYPKLSVLLTSVCNLWEPRPCIGNFRDLFEMMKLLKRNLHNLQHDCNIALLPKQIYTRRPCSASTAALVKNNTGRNRRRKPHNNVK